MGGCGCNKGQRASKLFKDCGCGCKGKKQEHKFIISIMSALIFFVVANPETFRAVRKLVGGWVSSPTGCPTIKGLALHSVVFLLVVWSLMNIRREGEEMAPPNEQMNAGAEAEAEAEAEDAPALPPAEPKPDVEPDMDDILNNINETPAVDSKIDINVSMEGPPVKPQGMDNVNDMGSDDDYEENTLAPYSPIESDNPSMDTMAMATNGSMSQKLGGSVATTQPQEALKTGNYMQCKCGDGSHVMLMK